MVLLIRMLRITAIAIAVGCFAIKALAIDICESSVTQSGLPNITPMVFLIKASDKLPEHSRFEHLITDLNQELASPQRIDLLWRNHTDKIDSPQVATDGSISIYVDRNYETNPNVIAASVKMLAEIKGAIAAARDGKANYRLPITDPDSFRQVFAAGRLESALTATKVRLDYLKLALAENLITDTDLPRHLSACLQILEKFAHAPRELDEKLELQIVNSPSAFGDAGRFFSDDSLTLADLAWPLIKRNVNKS